MDFRKFIESLGDALGMRLENAGGACGLDVDGVTVMLHDADDLVFLAAEIGPPPPEDGLETLFRTVLKANWLYRGTGGATLAINPEDGCIWLEKYNFLERLDGGEAAGGPLTGRKIVAADRDYVRSHFPINGDYAMPEGSTAGKCRATQEFVIDFTGAEPEIRGYKVGQALE